jgi:hypothetical protein
MALPIDPIGAGGILPGAGIGKSLNIDIGAGLGGGLGGLGGLFPGGLAGFAGGVPYVPITPLGALEGFKGDLIVPMVIIGVALFLLLIIVLAVKFAIAFKLSLLKGIVAEKKDKFDHRRDAPGSGGQPPQEDELNQLAHIVLTAIQSQSCAQNMVCELGILARERQGLPSLLRILSTLVPTSLQDPLNILRTSAEGSFQCEDKYPCSNSNSTAAGAGAAGNNSTSTSTASTNQAKNNLD